MLKSNIFIALGALCVAVFSLASCASTPSTETPAVQYARAVAAIDLASDDLIAFRHDLHRHPELSGEERETSRKVAEQLRNLGYDVQTNIGGYGVVATLEGHLPGPMIAFRADMDAVADTNVDPVPYASTVPGVRHICGHDVHTAIGIGLAIAFAEIRDTLPGGVMLVFQPEEESGTGAENMLRDGLFSNQHPDAILALHTAPMNLGELAVSPGGMMAGRSLVTVTLEGDGDLDAAAARIRDALRGAGNVSGPEIFGFHPPTAVAVDVFPVASQGDAGSAQVRAFVMSAGIERREAVESRVRDALNAVDLGRLEMTVAYEQALEGVNNDPGILNAASRGIQNFEPTLTIQDWPGIIPAFSEDFGSMQREVPGVMFFIGVSNPERGTVGFPHSPDYVADDAAISLGTRAMLAASLNLMTELDRAADR